MAVFAVHIEWPWLGLLACLAAAGSAAAAPAAAPLDIRFIGNEAFSINDGHTTLLTDFPYQPGYSGYMTYDMVTVRRSGRKIDARRIVIYHHTAGQQVPDCDGCSIPRQGERLGVAATPAAPDPMTPAPAAPAPGTARPAAADPRAETVVLLHGLGRSPRSMGRLGKALEARGYDVVNVGYPSRRRTIEELSDHLAAEMTRCCAGRAGRVHFVTHSLGGIVIRHYLGHHRVANLGRVVMLGPPNGGSELVDLVKRLPVLRHHIGPSRGQLGTDPASPPARLGPVDFDLGVIAGTRSWNPLFSWLLPGPDDGMVAVDRTRVEGMSDFLAVPRSHPFLMRSSEVARQTVAFLRDGAFDRDLRAPAAGRDRGSP